MMPEIAKKQLSEYEQSLNKSKGKEKAVVGSTQTQPRPKPKKKKNGTNSRGNKSSQNPKGMQITIILHSKRTVLNYGDRMLISLLLTDQLQHKYNSVSSSARHGFHVHIQIYLLKTFD